MFVCIYGPKVAAGSGPVSGFNSWNQFSFIYPGEENP